MDLSKDIKKISDFEERALFLFQKKTYEGACDDYKTEAAGLIGRFKEPDFDAKDAANQFVEYFQNDLVQMKGLKALQKNKALYNHNMYMVCYVLPYFMELDGVYKDFAGLLAEKWNGSFKRSNIQAATFSEVSAGFITRLFGTVINDS